MPPGALRAATFQPFGQRTAHTERASKAPEAAQPSQCSGSRERGVPAGVRANTDASSAPQSAIPQSTTVRRHRSQCHSQMQPTQGRPKSCALGTGYETQLTTPSQTPSYYSADCRLPEKGYLAQHRACEGRQQTDGKAGASLPQAWSQHLTDPTTVPWLPHLPPEAQGSLYEFGRYLLSLTPAGRRGTVTTEQYDQWCKPVTQEPAAGHRPAPAAVLVRVCAAFGYSPLALVADVRAVLRCIDLAVKAVLQARDNTLVKPSTVEVGLKRMCAYCAKDTSPKEEEEVIGPRLELVFCDTVCMDEHMRLAEPAIRKLMCWPVGRVDDLFFASIHRKQQAARSRPKPPDSIRDARMQQRVARQQAMVERQYVARGSRTAAKCKDREHDEVDCSSFERDPQTPCKQMTLTDLAVMSDLAWAPWMDAARDGRPMLWHVRRRTLERAAARMGLPAADVQTLLQLAAHTGDACGTVALGVSWPYGGSKHPEQDTLRLLWTALLERTTHLVFYALSEAAVCTVLDMYVKCALQDTDAEITTLLVELVCATCGRSYPNTTLHTCRACMSVSFCSLQCREGHVSSGVCRLLSMDTPWTLLGHDRMLPSFTCTHTPMPTPGTHDCEAEQGSGTHSAGLRVHKQHLSRGQAIAAEYAQCAQTHPHLKRVAQVILPPCGERHPDSPAVVAAHEMLVCAAGLLDDKDWEEIMRVCDGL